ncbi:MAG TPA: hypothetical protein VGI16_12390 [Candidatus Acidoferrum sp.]|jgi:hypothetical protein
MPTANKPSTSITVAGVVAIAGSVLCMLGVALTIFMFSAMPQTAPTAHLPPHFRSLVIGEFLVAFAITVFGIFCGVGLLRLKNWARIATLICSGFTAVVCGVCVLAFAFVPLPTPPVQPPVPMGIVRALISVVYAIPLGVAIWWLILFNRKKIVAQFTAQPVAANVEGDPQGMIPIEPIAAKPAVPVPIIALAVLFIAGSLSFVFLFAMPFPLIFFGHAFYGVTRLVVLVLSCVAYLAAGIGLLGARRWAYTLGLGVQSFWLLSGIVSILSPGFEATMRDMMSSMSSVYGENIGTAYTLQHLRMYTSIGFVFSIVVIGIFLSYRRVFMEAVAARS